LRGIRAVSGRRFGLAATLVFGLGEAAALARAARFSRMAARAAIVLSATASAKTYPSRIAAGVL